MTSSTSLVVPALAVVIYGAGAGAAAATPPWHPGIAAQVDDDGERARRRRPRPARTPDPKPLWSLYPLDAEANTPPGPPEQAPEPAVPAQGAVPGVQPAGEERSREAPLWAWTGVVAVLIAVALGFATRARRRPQLAGAAPSRSTPSPEVAAPPSAAGTPPAEPARARASPEIAREHVRVHLLDGRRIEGWRRGAPTSDRRVIVLDVDEVYDATGERVESRPLDSFLLPPQVERIELLDAPSGGRRDARR
jgi:hypothetical protein